MAGSSVETLTRTPASMNRRIGCASSDAMAPVATFEPGHAVTGSRRSARYATSEGSSTARSPWSMRSTPNAPIAPQMLSGPATSPAWAVVRNPRALALSYTGANGSGGKDCSDPPRPIPITPASAATSAKSSSVRAPTTGP